MYLCKIVPPNKWNPFSKMSFFKHMKFEYKALQKYWLKCIKVLMKAFVVCHCNTKCRCEPVNEVTAVEQTCKLGLGLSFGFVLHELFVHINKTGLYSQLWWAQTNKSTQLIWIWNMYCCNFWWLSLVMPSHLFLCSFHFSVISRCSKYVIVMTLCIVDLWACSS